MDRIVEISQSGRGGSIYYREGNNSASFDWEFASPPALALVFGPKSEAWDRRYPWAGGRQAEIFDFVASEVVRQKAAGAGIEIDLEGGIISVFSPREPKPSRSPRKIPKPPAEEPHHVALGQIDTPDARAEVDAAFRDHLSADRRLAAAEIMHSQGRLPNLENFLATEIRNLDRPANGLERALRMAELHPTDEVKHALLYASYNATECAPQCARLLLLLSGSAKEPFDGNLQDMLRKLDLHNSYFDRKAAFDQLCRIVGMTLR